MLTVGSIASAYASFPSAMYSLFSRVAANSSESLQFGSVVPASSDSDSARSITVW